MASKQADLTLKIVAEECRRILDVRPLIVREQREWWGVGVLMENPDRALLRILVDFREGCVDVNFMSPVHLNKERTFVTWPHFDDPRHRFALWQVFKIRGETYDDLTGSIDVRDLELLKRFLHRAVDAILESCLPILDGDLFVGSDIAANRGRSAWDSDGA